MIKIPLNNHLFIIRFILIVGMACIPAFGIVNNIFNQDYSDPLLYRLLLSGSCGIVLFLSYRSKFVKKHLQWFLYFLYLMVFIWIQYVLYVNNLSSYYAMGSFIIYIGMSLGIQNRYHLRFFLILYPVISAMIVMQIASPEMEVLPYVMRLGLLMFLTFIVLDNFLLFREQLQNSNDNFRTLFNNIHESFFLLDKTFKIQKMNEKSRNHSKKFLITNNQLYEGDNILKVIPSHYLLDFKKNFAEALNGKNLQFEKKIGEDSNKNAIWYLFTFAPVNDEYGNIKGVLFTKSDITQRKLAEEKIRNSEERYRLIAEHSSDMISVHLPDGTITYVSPSCKYVMGYEQEELIGKSPFSHHHPSDINKIKDAHKKLVSRSCSITIEFRSQNKKGEYVWLESTQKSVSDGNGSIKEIISTTREITGRKMVEEEIIRSEAQLKAIFNSVNLAVYSFDNNNRLITFNQRFRKYIKILLKKEVRKDEYIDSFIPSDLKDDVTYQHNEVKKGRVIHKDYRISLKSNNDYWIEFFAYPLMEENEITGAIVLIRDITARKKAEIALEKSENWFRNLFNNAPNGMALADLQGTFVHVNKSFAEMFGYKIEEMIGQNFKDFSHPDDIEINVTSNQKLIDNQLTNYELEKRYIHKDGSTIYTILNVTILKDEQDVPHRILGQVVDITERKKSENKLIRKNEELAKANEELDRFVYSASHDLRSPLSSILGLINLSYADIDSSEKYKYLYYMEKSVKRLDRFIGDILDYSKNSRIEVSYEEIDINALTDDIIEDLNFIDNYDKIAFFKDIDVDKIVSDKKRIKIIFNNLLTNAFRYYNPENKNPYVALRVSKTDGHLLISVEDNGIGIEEDQKNKIFEMFYRGTERTKGSGLGLFIVKESVDKLDGEIFLKSKPNAGSCFTVKIPEPVKELSYSEDDYH